MRTSTQRDDTVTVRAGRSIAAKLARRLLVAVLLPLLTLGGVALIAVRSIGSDTESQVDASRASLADDVVAGALRDQGDRLIADVETFVGERINEAASLAEHETLVRAAQDGAAEAATLGLAELDAAELEDRFADGQTLGASPDADELLAHRVDDSAFVSALVATDTAGHTVASSAPPARFFLGGDATWTEASEGGVGVSPIAFDATSNRFTIDVDVPLLDATHETVGVLRASIDVSYLQDLADSVAASTGTQVTIANGSGLLLAETATGHDLARIMNAELVIDPAIEGALVQALAETRSSGAFRTSGQVTGFSRSTESQVGAALGLVAVVGQDEATALAPLLGLESLRTDVEETASQLSILLIAILLITVVATVVLPRALVRGIVHPIEVLRDHARYVAQVELPRVVAEIDRLDDGDPLPELARVSVDTGDEVQELAEAFSSVQNTAVRLAAEQAIARRRNVAAAFVSMGRRNQNLIGRQLKFIEELEQNESDPRALANLFKLDHLATRLRRNAESLLVLAGEEPPRRWSQPVSIIDVVRSAAAEIEEFERVELSRMDEQPVHGAVVSELAHLLAELVENALIFSPPQTRVLVAGRARPEGYELAIVDQGIGMTAEELQEVNERLASPVDFDRAPSQRVGLFVVGRLASRHGVRVRLLPSTSGEGITALLLLPAPLLAAPDPNLENRTFDPAPVAATSVLSASPTHTEGPTAAAPLAEPVLERHETRPPAPMSPMAGPGPSDAPTSVPPVLLRRDGPTPDGPTGVTEPVRPSPAERVVPADSEAGRMVPAPPDLPRRDGPGVASGGANAFAPTGLPNREATSAHAAQPAPQPQRQLQPTEAPADAMAPLPSGIAARPSEGTASSTPARPTIPTGLPASALEPSVTPSGLRRRQPVGAAPVTAGSMRANDAGASPDPDEVRATLRRFMTGVSHGRRLVTDATTPGNTVDDDAPLGGGQNE